MPTIPETKETKRKCPLVHKDDSEGIIHIQKIFTSDPNPVLGGTPSGTTTWIYFCNTCKAIFNLEPTKEEEDEDAEERRKFSFEEEIA